MSKVELCMHILACVCQYFYLHACACFSFLCVCEYEHTCCTWHVCCMQSNLLFVMCLVDWCSCIQYVCVCVISSCCPIFCVRLFYIIIILYSAMSSTSTYSKRSCYYIFSWFYSWLWWRNIGYIHLWSWFPSGRNCNSNVLNLNDMVWPASCVWT